MHYTSQKKNQFKFFLLLIINLSSCSSINGEDQAKIENIFPSKVESIPRPLVFWSTENQPDRIEKTKQIIEKFTQKTGITVELVLVEENSIDNLMRSSHTAGILPDVVFFPLDFASIWYSQGILDAKASSEVINLLGVSTFSKGAIDFVTVASGDYIAIPSDGWGQLLIYRADLFDQLGLEPPLTFENIRIASEELKKAGYIGILAGTDPNEVYTQQTFEHFALANGVTLIDDFGNIQINSPEMIETLTYYTELMSNYGPGNTTTYWLQAREKYFAGEAGMIIWSPFILDEMAGLRDSVLPNCPECIENQEFLVDVSGIVPSISGPTGHPSQWGSINYLGIIAGNKTDDASQFAYYWMSEGYLEWLSIAPEGMTPMRLGNHENPTLYQDNWSFLNVGVDKKVPFVDIYSAAILRIIIEGSNNFQRWGLRPENTNSELVGAIYSNLIIPRAIADIMEGSITPEEAVENLQIQIEELLFDLNLEQE